MKSGEDESIVRPRSVRGFNRERVVCIPFDPAPKILLAHIEKRAVSERRLGGSMLYILPESAVLYRCLGGPAAVAGLEFLIASGASEILTLSFCGSLDREFRIGDVLCAEWAYPDEGTSRHYSPRKRRFKADASLRKHVESRLISLGLPWKTGSLVSTDAPYRETPSWLKSMRQKGARAVDMEISAVFALSEFRGVKAAALLIVTDELFSGRWKVCSTEGVLGRKIGDFYLPFL